MSIVDDMLDDMRGAGRRLVAEEAFGAALLYLDCHLELHPEDDLAHDASDALELFIATVYPRAMPRPVDSTLKAKVHAAKTARAEARAKPVPVMLKGRP